MISRLATPDWDAKAYQQFSRLRQQPVVELLGRDDADTERQGRSRLGKAGGVAQQVRQRALDQRFVDRQRGVALDAQGQAGVFQRGLRPCGPGTRLSAQ